MRNFLKLSLVLLVVQLAVAPPVTKNKKDEAEKEKNENDAVESEEMEEVMEYARYLKEVVQALESDADFRQKLEKADEADIKTGKIAHELEFVNHQVRTKLDELKRQELERLRHLALKEYQLENGLDPEHLKIAEHLDHENPHTFEIDDLKKLIAKTTQDLAEADRKRKEEFKEYEMQKKFGQELKKTGNGMDEEQRKKYEAELHLQEEKHKKHEPLHHPGSKQQLEEVWEQQDHMENQEFDPRTFFYLHDLDGNGVWDQNEVKALFLKELDKMYAKGAPEDDLRERAEEMERMREHVFKEADLNNDMLISYTEFLEQTKKPDFQQDEGWKGLDEQQIFSEQEYENFERHRQQEIQDMIAKGILPPNPANYPSGHPDTFPPQYRNAEVHPGLPQPGHVDPSIHPNEIPHGQQFQGQQHVPQQHFQGQQPTPQQFQQQQHQQQQHQQHQQQQQQQQQQQYQQQQQQFQGHQQQQHPSQGGGNKAPVPNIIPLTNQVPNNANINVVQQQHQVNTKQTPIQQQPNIVPQVVNAHS